MGEKERHPVYRLIDGRIMCQAQPGARWQLVDDSVADRMLKTFDGLEPGRLTTMQLDRPGAPGRARDSKAEV